MITLAKEIHRITPDAFFTFGPHRNRAFVATLTVADKKAAIRLRPKGCRRESSIVVVALVDVYNWALRSRAFAAAGAKARDKRLKKLEAAKRRRLDREIRAAAG